MDRLEATFLPAREGDAIWIRWGDGHQMLIDMGRAETGRGLIDRLRALPVDARSFELLVITHVDRDHIEGVLTVLVDNGFRAFIAPSEPLDHEHLDWDGFTDAERDVIPWPFEALPPSTAPQQVPANEVPTARPPGKR